ncbi:hypothetical protein [Pedobacter suwonensis]|uniref:hypothetical protein n=1 Tax=Pedobacter suwonensis TaxID=332999 RepID=UPI00369A36BE
MKNKNILIQTSKKTSVIRTSAIVFLLALSLVSCKKYLDIVPDNVATLDNAFSLRNEAEKYLFTCYSFMPSNGNPLANMGYMTGDEIWTFFG